MKEYDIYVPTRLNDGSHVPPSFLEQLKTSLRERFGGCTHFNHPNEGQWKMGRVVFKEAVTVLRVLSDDSKQQSVDASRGGNTSNSSSSFFTALKARMAKELGQEEILIVAREVEII